MRTVAAFDFDKTLTNSDTLVRFVWFSCGIGRLLAGFLFYSPLLVLMKLHLYPNWKAKQKVFAYFFRGCDYHHFQQLGQEFANEVERIKNNETVEKLEAHLAKGDTVYVVSASIAEWVRPWCEGQGVSGVIATEVEVDDKGCLTGRFKSRNCYGKEKVRRLLEFEPNRASYCLYAYGDGRGDRELLAFADKPQTVIAHSSR